MWEKEWEGGRDTQHERQACRQEGHAGGVWPALPSRDIKLHINSIVKRSFILSANNKDLFIAQYLKTTSDNFTQFPKFLLSSINSVLRFLEIGYAVPGVHLAAIAFCRCCGPKRDHLTRTLLTKLQPLSVCSPSQHVLQYWSLRSSRWRTTFSPCLVSTLTTCTNIT